MGIIVCATRGGEASRVLQTQAIEKAREENKPLLFVYVVNTDAIQELDENLVDAAVEELTWFGKALLKTAQLRGRYRGVEVDTIVCRGDVRARIVEVLTTKDVDMLLLGRPQAAPRRNFSEDSIIGFAHYIQQETGVPVEVLSLETPPLLDK